jgi:DNA polymerase-3 subunit gamma/tau
MKKLFGVALLALPFLAASAHAEGSPFNVQAGGSFYIKGSHGAAMPQAGPCYLYWPLDAHPVAPAPTGYPYWPGPQVLPPPAVAAAPGVVPAPIPVPQTAPQAAPIPAPQTAPQAAPLPAPQTTPPAAPQTAPRTIPQGILPPYLQPTGYSPTGYTGQAPSYWYDR